MRSLQPSDPQRPDVLARGLVLLDDLKQDAARADGGVMSKKLAAARAELLAIPIDA